MPPLAAGAADPAIAKPLAGALSVAGANGTLARRLHDRLQGEKLRVWFAPEDMRGGRKNAEQIDEAIRLYDRLLLVLSEQGEVVLAAFDPGEMRAPFVGHNRDGDARRRAVSFDHLSGAERVGQIRAGIGHDEEAEGLCAQVAKWLSA